MIVRQWQWQWMGGSVAVWQCNSEWQCGSATVDGSVTVDVRGNGIMQFTTVSAFHI
jgi:hypothetical protein